MTGKVQDPVESNAVESQASNNKAAFHHPD